jgi:hypothetical protein
MELAGFVVATDSPAGISTSATPDADDTSTSVASNGSSGSIEPHGTTFRRG